LTYNEEDYIGKNISSVRSQTYQNFEHIIIDDCSTDSTPEVVKLLLYEKAVLKEHKINRGIDFLISNYNEALRYATGDYGILLDGDDYLLPNALETFRRVLEPGMSLCFGRCGNLVDGKIIILPNVKELSSEELFQKFFYEDYFYTPATTFSIPILKEIGGLQGYKGVFHVTFLLLCTHGKFKHIRNVIGMRTIRRDSVSFHTSLKKAYEETERSYILNGLDKLTDMNRVRRHWRFNLWKDRLVRLKYKARFYCARLK
jgi:glycosyltransferase involved in cell wall biosynthesis